MKKKKQKKTLETLFYKLHYVFPSVSSIQAVLWLSQNSSSLLYLPALLQQNSSGSSQFLEEFFKPHIFLDSFDSKYFCHLKHLQLLS